MSQDYEWWEGFFSGSWVDAQRQTKTPELVAAEAEMIERVLEGSHNLSILDVPCGEGRLSLELAKRGHQITGVDLSWEMLEEARQKGDHQHMKVAWNHGDMQCLTFESEFDAAVCFWGSMGYFDEAGNRDFFRGVWRALRSGGSFVLDTHVAESLFPNFVKKHWLHVGEAVVLEERRYDHVSGRVESLWTFVRAGIKQQRRSSIQLYTFRELCAALKEAGFREFHGYGDPSMTPFELGSPRLYLVARK